MTGRLAALAGLLLLLFAQGVAELIKRVAALRGYVDDTAEYERPLQ